MGIQARLTADPHFAHVMSLPFDVVNRRYIGGSIPNLIDMTIICALRIEEAIYHGESRDRQVIEDLLEDRADGWTPAMSVDWATQCDDYSGAPLPRTLYLQEQLFA